MSICFVTSGNSNLRDRSDAAGSSLLPLQRLYFLWWSQFFSNPLYLSEEMCLPFQTCGPMSPLFIMNIPWGRQKSLWLLSIVWGLVGSQYWNWTQGPMHASLPSLNYTSTPIDFLPHSLLTNKFWYLILGPWTASTNLLSLSTLWVQAIITLLFNYFSLSY